MSTPTAPTVRDPATTGAAPIASAGETLVGPRVVFEDVTIRAPGGAFWLDEIRFSVPAGGHVAIVGCSGTGKSVLLQAVLDLHRVDGGCVRVDGGAVDAFSYRALQELRTHTGYVFERQALLSNQTLRENVALPLVYHRGHQAIDLAGTVSALLRELELEAAADLRPATCNASIRKRALVARALILEPTLLLLEEPQAALVPREQRLVSEAIERRHTLRGMTLLQTDHDGDFGALFPEQVVEIAGGKVVSVKAMSDR